MLSCLFLERGRAALVLLLCAVGCGEDDGGDRRVPSNPAEVEHRRICDERCEEETRCSDQALPAQTCQANCDAMLPIEACRDLHAAYFECLTRRVPCDNYDRAAEVACGEEFRAFFLDCEAWRDFEESRPDPAEPGFGDAGPME